MIGGRNAVGSVSGVTALRWGTTYRTAEGCRVREPHIQMKYPCWQLSYTLHRFGGGNHPSHRRTALACSSVVERLTVNQNVVGSIPTLPVGDTWLTLSKHSSKKGYERAFTTGGRGSPTCTLPRENYSAVCPVGRGCGLENRLDVKVSGVQIPNTAYGALP